MRLLVLAPFAPRRDATNGGGRVAAHLLLGLAARHEVALLCVRRPDDLPADEELRRRCALLEEFLPVRSQPSAGLRQRLRKHIRRAASALVRPAWAAHCIAPDLAARLGTLAPAFRPDIVQAEYHVMGQYLPALNGWPARRVLNQYEPGAAAARERWRAARGAARLRGRLELAAWERFERQVVRGVDAVVVFTERDRDAMAPLARPGTAVVTIPPGATLPERPADPAGRPPHAVLFVGSFHHPPNAEAAVRLAASIFPAVRERCPEAVLHLVGEAPPEEVRRAAGPGVEVTGRVPEVWPYLERAAVVVAPLARGGGMRIKVLEALAAGKALVASPLAVEGLDVRDGEEVVLAESDRDVAAAVAALLADRERRVALAGRARAWAVAHLSWERTVAGYEALYERLLAAGGEGGR